MIIRVNYSMVVFFRTLCYSPLDDVSTEIEKHVVDKVNHVSDNGHVRRGIQGGSISDIAKRQLSCFSPRQMQ